jgi:phosphate transport system substrate-binding protein
MLFQPKLPLWQGLLFIYIVISLCACERHVPSLRIKGSDTEVNLVLLLAEAFHQNHPGVSMSVSGGGSGLGIASLLNGQADIANSSRPMNAFEKELFAKKRLKVIPFEFAQDALVILVHKENPIDSLTIDEMGAIFSGKKTTWDHMSDKQKITIYGRQNNSGTHAYLKHKLDIEFSDKAKEMNGNAQIIEAIKSDKSGIGYVGAGYVLTGGKINSDGFKVLRLSEKNGHLAYSPTDSIAVREKKYALQRPLYQYILAQSYERAKPFLEFEKSQVGLTIIEHNGYFKIANH